jgi:hypothetical protein
MIRFLRRAALVASLIPMVARAQAPAASKDWLFCRDLACVNVSFRLFEWPDAPSTFEIGLRNLQGTTPGDAFAWTTLNYLDLTTSKPGLGDLHIASLTPEARGGATNTGPDWLNVAPADRPSLRGYVPNSEPWVSFGLGGCGTGSYFDAAKNWTIGSETCAAGSELVFRGAISGTVFVEDLQVSIATIGVRKTGELDIADCSSRNLGDCDPIITIDPVPEPSTFALVATALLVLYGVRRRRHQRILVADPRMV